MDSIDQMERRVRMRYEGGRLRLAVLGFAPVLVVVTIAAVLGKRPLAALAFGAATFAVGTLVLWYGRDLRRAVLPGVALGTVPLVLALCANHVGHACTGDGCMMLCVPACTAGGLVAGIALGVLGLRRRGGVGFWVAGSALALLTGGMGCACAGLSGIAGLGIGFVTGIAPGALRRLLVRPAA